MGKPHWAPTVRAHSTHCPPLNHFCFSPLSLLFVHPPPGSVPPLGDFAPTTDTLMAQGWVYPSALALYEHQSQSVPFPPGLRLEPCCAPHPKELCPKEPCPCLSLCGAECQPGDTSLQPCTLCCISTNQNSLFFPICRSDPDKNG